MSFKRVCNVSSETIVEDCGSYGGSQNRSEQIQLHIYDAISRRCETFDQNHERIPSVACGFSQWCSSRTDRYGGITKVIAPLIHRQYRQSSAQLVPQEFSRGLTEVGTRIFSEFFYAVGHFYSEVARLYSLFRFLFTRDFSEKYDGNQHHWFLV